MANPISVVTAAIKAVKAGLSANQGYRDFQAGGGGVARGTWLRTVAEVRRTLADQMDEALRPLNRRPTAGEITPVTSKTKSGYIQMAEVYVKDRETGDVVAKPFSFRATALSSRQGVLNMALNAFDDGVTGSPDRFNEQVLGATYTGTIQLIPRGEV